MDPTLPHPVRLNLERTLAQWRHWSPAPAREPTVIEALTAGRSNTSVTVGDGEGQWVVRIDGMDPAQLGLHRNAEWRCLMNAAAAGLSPQPVYRNPDLGVLVCEYHAPDGHPPTGLEAVAALLREIHRLPAIHHRLDPLARGRLYTGLAGGGGLPAELVQACDRLQETPASLCLCHNDLLRANRLSSGGEMLALDWEYAAMGDPLFDLAVVIEGDGLDEAAALALHGEWLQRLPTPVEKRRLADQRQVYRSLAELWERIPR